MKPIRLKFSGLQSYRDEQDIDFAELGSLGIFGVFGPTGSGKSTILDAITLALFGKVERAKSGTRGILNQFEDRLSVSFAFSLGDDIYLAERLYAREKNDPDAVRNRHARLIKLTADNQVLADKANEMDNKVAHLLGMSFDDFSRAVILPQGKFDQFLKLTGGDRARMLENILRLERYGENLWKKASRMENSLGQEIHTDQMLLEQLGDASEEAITQAEEKLSRHNKLVLQREQTKKDTETALKELEQLELLYREFAALKQQQTELEAQKAGLEIDRSKLEWAIKAEPLKGILIQAVDLEKSEKEETVKFLQQQDCLTRTEVKLKLAEDGIIKSGLAEEKLQNLREQELPKVVLALDYERQIKVLAKELQGMHENLRQKQGELDKLTVAGKEKGQRHTQAKTDREKLLLKKQELAEVLAIRPQVESAGAVLVDLESAEQQVLEAAQALAGRQQAQAAAERTLKTDLSEYLDSSLVDKPEEKSEDNPKYINALVTGVAAQANEGLTQAQDFYDKLIMENMAGSLAAKLSPGAPCPVCGSTSHPLRAENHDENAASMESAKDRIKAARAGLDKVMAWERKVGLAYNTLRTISEEISTVHRPNLDRKQAALAAALAKWQQQTALMADYVSVIHSLTGMPAIDRTGIKMAKKALVMAEQEYKTIEMKLAAGESEIKGLETELNQLREAFLGLKYEIANLQNNGQTAEENDSRLKTALAGITGELAAEEFQQKINVQVLLLQSEITEAKNTLDNARLEIQEAEKVLEALKAGLEKTTSHLNKVRESLEKSMTKQGFAEISELWSALLSEELQQNIRKRLDDYAKARDFVDQRLREVSVKIKDKPFDLEKIASLRLNLEKIQEEYDEAVREQGALKKSLGDLKNRQVEWLRLKAEINRLTQRRELAVRLVSLLKGRKLVQFLAEEHLRDMAAEASVRLAGLTGQRYALELDEGCNFVMRDNYNAGQRRPVNTLSGGETFLTSLSLALALSSKIQLKGQFPLGFFFLDEGFGTLDPEKLEVVVNALEKLHDGHRLVGIITHVPELRSRMPRYLEILASTNDGAGSKVLMKKS